MACLDWQRVRSDGVWLENAWEALTFIQARLCIEYTCCASSSLASLQSRSFAENSHVHTVHILISSSCPRPHLARLTRLHSSVGLSSTLLVAVYQYFSAYAPKPCLDSNSAFRPHENRGTRERWQRLVGWLSRRYGACSTGARGRALV